MKKQAAEMMKQLCVGYVESYFDDFDGDLDLEIDERKNLLNFLMNLTSVTKHPVELLFLLKLEGWDKDDACEFVLGGANTAMDRDICQKAIAEWDSLAQKIVKKGKKKKKKGNSEWLEKL